MVGLTSLFNQDIIEQTENMQQANECLNKIIGPHELFDVGSKDPLKFSFNGERIGGITIGELIYGKDVVFKTSDQMDMRYYCITRPIQGTPIFKKSANFFHTNYCTAAIVSPFDKFELEVEQNCVQSFISISRPLLENTLAELIQRPLSTPIHFDHSMSKENEKMNAWWNLLEYLTSAHKDQFDFSCLMPEIKPNFEYILVKTLLMSQPHNYSDLLYGSNNRVPTYLKHAIQFIHENIHHMIRIEDLEQFLGVSRTKISRDFRHFFKTTPQLYIRYYRLKCIQQELLVAQNGNNITSVAMKWGINHLGRFSIDYKKLFGESPSDTYRKAGF